MAVWQGTGPLTSFLRTYTNEVVNELFFDLRPITDGDSTEYLRVPDEISGNEGDGTGITGITHAPAVIMREYPWGTIDEFDGEGVKINIKDADNQEVELGRVPIGAVFSHEPTVPGRHLIPFPAISYSRQVRGKFLEVYKRKLDVAVVHQEEIKKTSFGRSDHDHVNLIETTTEDGLLGANAKFFMQSLQPIITPIHVLRNGLRLKSTSTRYARFSPDTAGSTEPGADPKNSKKEAEALLAAQKAEKSEPSVAVRSPIEGGGTDPNPGRFRRWGYRRTDDRKTVSGKPAYKFHNGIDLFAPIGTEVIAIADGEVVMSAPPDGRGVGGYSQSIMLKHPGLGPSGEDLYSFYAHLSERLIDARPGEQAGDPVRKRFVKFVTKDVDAGGLPQGSLGTVKAGQPIGRVGNLSGSVNNPGKTFSGPHLHFELILKTDGKVYPSGHGVLRPAQIAAAEKEGHLVYRPIDTNKKSKTFGERVLKPQHGAFGDTPHIDPNGVPVVIGEPPLGLTNKRTLDPEVFFEEHDIDLIAVVTGGAPKPDLPPPEEVVEGDDASPPDEEEESAPEEEKTEPTPLEVFTSSSRSQQKIESRISGAIPFRQLARWSLLQHHWFQHNTEYLSGTIDMRGAPEIRVGYRLDLPKPGRELSFYVAGVSHAWNFPSDMTTTLQVTRGQTHNPFPLYVPPTPLET
jgi:murein DD-endopeptidase MepM/ murein hydrolase activator NlpD